MPNASRNQVNRASLILRRGREERLAQAAGGLTFATVVSIVPLLAVSFALFSRIPALRPAGDAIREHLLRGLLPADITRTVLKHLAQFTGNATGLTLGGFGVLLVSALALLLSVENTFNRIWQAKQPRPLPRRLALCFCMLLTGPMILGASLWATSYLLASSRGMAGTLGAVGLGAAGFTCLFRFVPHAAVRWREAITGGLLAGIAFEFGKRGFAIYLANVPAYRTIYGAFAPLLAFLVWVYYSWFITLGAALIGASGGQRKATSRRQGSRAPAS